MRLSSLLTGPESSPLQRSSDQEAQLFLLTNCHYEQLHVCWITYPS